MKRPLDFICIGATKGGTTSFYHYIKNHPEIYVPPRKEVMYFDDDETISKGWDAFYKEHFYEARENQKLGKMSPRYLRDARVPQRIAEVNPEIKLLLIARNPIDRAFSHYKMLKRLGRESREFKQLINDQLTPDALATSRASVLPGEFSLLVQSEYGRILQNYYKFFKPEQILILFSENLEKEPINCLAKFYDLIDVKYWVPPNLNQRYHVGGDKASFLWLYPLLKKLYLPKLIWRTFQDKTRKKLILWYNTKLKVASKSKSSMEDEDRERLQKFYKADVELLSKLLQVTPPWRDFVSH